MSSLPTGLEGGYDRLAPASAASSNLLDCGIQKIGKTNLENAQLTLRAGDFSQALNTNSTLQAGNQRDSPAPVTPSITVSTRSAAVETVCFKPLGQWTSTCCGARAGPSPKWSGAVVDEA